MTDDVLPNPEQSDPDWSEPKEIGSKPTTPAEDALAAEAVSQASASDTFEQAVDGSLEPAPSARKGKAAPTPEPAVEPAAAPKLERLQKILAQAGVASRRHAEEMITQGRVQINGKVVTELGTKADAAHDHIRVDGKLLQGSERLRYFMLNKPRGFVTTVSDPEGRPTIMQFFTRMNERLYPVGRLDYLSEGLLLVTNDGELANKLTRAASGVEKTYLVKVSGQPTDEEIDRLREGVAIERDKPGSGRVPTAPAEIRRVRKGDNPWYEVVLIEGRNRELRKMFEEIGHHVEKIRRVGYGPLVLDLEPGNLRELEPEEVENLRKAAEGKYRKPKAAVERKRSAPPESRRLAGRPRPSQYGGEARGQRGSFRSPERPARQAPPARPERRAEGGASRPPAGGEFRSRPRGEFPSKPRFEGTRPPRPDFRSPGRPERPVRPVRPERPGPQERPVRPERRAEGSASRPPAGGEFRSRPRSEFPSKPRFEGTRPPRADFRGPGRPERPARPERPERRAEGGAPRGPERDEFPSRPRGEFKPRLHIEEILPHSPRQGEGSDRAATRPERFEKSRPRPSGKFGARPGPGARPQRSGEGRSNTRSGPRSGPGSGPRPGPRPGFDRSASASRFKGPQRPRPDRDSSEKRPPFAPDRDREQRPRFDRTRPAGPSSRPGPRPGVRPGPQRETGPDRPQSGARPSRPQSAAGPSARPGRFNRSGPAGRGKSSTHKPGSTRPGAGRRPGSGPGRKPGKPGGKPGGGKRRG